MTEPLTSLQNPRLKRLIRLREPRERRAEGCFLVEGRREVERALLGGRQIAELYLGADFFRGPEDHDLAARLSPPAGQVFPCGRDAFAKVSHRDSPDGFLAVVRTWDLSLEQLPAPAASPLYLVCEGVEKPGNLGALLRVADAVGVAALITTDPGTDFFNPNVVRASQGSLFRVPAAVASNGELAAWLEARHVRIAATTPHTDKLLWDMDLRGPVAILMGAEDTGLSDFWLKDRAEVFPVRLPMAGLADSLNVSACAAVALFEAVRQRGQ